MANSKKMDCVMLGMLSHESLTGYEIKKRIDASLRYFWGASYGSIYPALDDLVANGLATADNGSDGGRNRVVYTITESGHEYLRTWLRMPVDKDELRYETLLKLFFGGEVGEEETLKHLTAFEEKISRELPVLKSAVNTLGGVQDTDGDHLYFLLSAMFGQKVYSAYLEWCGEAKKMLKERM